MPTRISASLIWDEDFGPPTCPAELLSGIFGLGDRSCAVPDMLDCARANGGVGNGPEWLPPADRPKAGQLMLVEAASLGWTDGLRQLIACGVDPEVRLTAPGDSRAGTIALHFAVAMGSAEAARYLHSLGFQPAELTRRHAAAMCAEPCARDLGLSAAEIARWKAGYTLGLLACGNRLEELRAWPKNAVEQVDLDLALLHATARTWIWFHEHYPVPDLLEMETPDFEFPESLFEYAAYHCITERLEAVQILLGLGANPRAFRGSALQLAMRLDSYELCSALLDASADPAVSDWGVLARIAGWADARRTRRIASRRGVPSEALSRALRDALFAPGQSPAAVRALLQAGADIARLDFGIVRSAMGGAKIQRVALLVRHGLDLSPLVTEDAPVDGNWVRAVPRDHPMYRQVAVAVVRSRL